MEPLTFLVVLLFGFGGGYAVKSGQNTKQNKPAIVQTLKSKG